MATLVFSTVGTILGGPLGGAIGALAGRQVDALVFGSGNRQGPRLKELEVTTSSYGQALPRHFGRMRVAGSVIWATELVEHSETQGGGKGAPSVTTYSYTASFAVALASRPILGIGRIWADGKLLRGAAGDLKAGGTLRIYRGQGDQPADPLIAASEGEDRCPACRGLAYVVFEDLDLSDFYNHVPALTFEVFADAAFDLQDILGEVIDGVDAGVALEGIAGFTSEGPLVDALETIGQVAVLDADAAGETLVLSRARLQAAPIPLSAPAVSAQDDDFGGGAGFTRHRAAAPDQPARILRYFDLGRDYLPGVQHASGRPAPGEPRAIELPAALEAADARALIERASRRLDWTRERVSWRTCELDPRVSPGALVTLPEIPGNWRVTEWEWRDTGVELALERAFPGWAPSLPADTGRAATAEDLPLARTRLVAFELPLDAAEGNLDAARPYAAVSASAGSWSGAALYADKGDGELHPLGPSGRARSVIGTAVTALAAAGPLLFDRSGIVTVELVEPEMTLASATPRQLASGANLALIGEEIVQFASALPLGGGAWRLSGFLRGRGGTEAATAGHMAGEAFVLLDRKAVALDPATLGAGPARQVVAIGRGDDDPVSAPILLGGITLRPLAPVHPRHALLSDGTLRLSWTRRARGGWQWQDGVDVPLVEQVESYLVTLGPVEAPLAMWTVDRPQLEIGAALLDELRAIAPGQPLRVRQRGTHALSLPLPICSLP